MEAAFALIHSPLVGPSTWAEVAQALREHGETALVARLEDAEGSSEPFWRQEAESAARSLQEDEAAGRALILVAHSGAGPLLPAIREALGRPVAGYLFVDAGLPHDGQSRLGEMRSTIPEYAEELHAELAAGGRFPTWTDEDLREIIPDARLRQATLDELRPRPLAFFEEPIPVFAGWPDAPCGYFQFSEGYAAAAAEAEAQRWEMRKIEAGHFHMLVDPDGVARMLREMAAQLEKAAE